jgi:hypothetical protein
MASKPGDFAGGVPQSEFDSYVQFYTDTKNTALMSNGQAAKAMAALAAEEHAAATSSGAANVVDVVMKCIDLRTLHLDITGAGGLGSADSQGNFPKVDAFIRLLKDLEKLWV